eukprot:2222369-Rhodomonas_salina.1
MAAEIQRRSGGDRAEIQRAEIGRRLPGAVEEEGGRVRELAERGALGGVAEEGEVVEGAVLLEPALVPEEADLLHRRLPAPRFPRAHLRVLQQEVEQRRRCGPAGAR